MYRTAKEGGSRNFKWNEGKIQMKTFKKQKSTKIWKVLTVSSLVGLKVFVV